MPIRSKTSSPKNTAMRVATKASTSLMALICGDVRMTMVGGGVLIGKRSIGYKLTARRFGLVPHQWNKSLR